MPDLLTIGGNALRTNQSALAVISNNIANVNTEGYVRQELDVSENLPSKLGTIYIGSGAVASGVKRAYDSLVEGSLRASLSDLSAQRPLIQYTQRLIDVFGNNTSSSHADADDSKLKNCENSSNDVRYRFGCYHLSLLLTHLSKKRYNK